MQQFVLASNNKNKIFEIQSSLKISTFECFTLQEVGIDANIPEPYDTIEANAEAKVDFIAPLTSHHIFAEDTGLEVVALHGEPGVKSARYAGNDCNMEANIQKLLLKMERENDRRAQFKTVICCCLQNKKHFFTGICKGEILLEPRGMNGFGYDSIFMPNGSDKSFAEMELREKKHFSHREKALQQFVQFLEK